MKKKGFIYQIVQEEDLLKSRAKVYAAGELYYCRGEIEDVKEIECSTGNCHFKNPVIRKVTFELVPPRKGKKNEARKKD